MSALAILLRKRAAPPARRHRSAIIIKKCRAPVACKRRAVTRPPHAARPSRECMHYARSRRDRCGMPAPATSQIEPSARRGRHGARGARAGACTLEITAGINHSIIEVSARTRPGTVFVMTRRYCSFLSPLAGPAPYASIYEFPLDDLLLYSILK